MDWGDGRKFRGSWQNDMKHGFGVFTNRDSSTISGTWINNKQHGYGIYMSAKQQRKYGAWKHGKKQETLSESKAKKLMSGEIDPKQFIEANDIEWAQIKSFSSKLFYATLKYEELRIQHERSAEQRIAKVIDQLERTKSAPT